MVLKMYTPTVWKENMNMAAKLAALDNMENMYTESTTYITSINHDSLYYTKAQADDKFYTSENDGHGSDLICETLDGMTMGEIVSEIFPHNIIALWAGLIADIPTGWHICDGTNGTPDLRDRFLIHVGGTMSPGDTGGSDTITSTATISVANHTLTAAQIAKHTHTAEDKYSGGALGVSKYTKDIAEAILTSMERICDNTGGGQAHNHTATWTGTSNQNKLPPYFALCYIMRV